MGCAPDDVRDRARIFFSDYLNRCAAPVFLGAGALGLCQSPRTGVMAVTLGASIGLGLLAKYAMGYFVLGMLLAAVFDRSARDLLRNRLVWLALGIALVIAAPNLIWVLHHDFVTFKNVAAVVQTDSGPRLHPLAALEFLAAQFAVFGPVVFAAFLLAIARIRSWEDAPANRIMLSFALPPLVIITLVALFSRAYANWAATGAISATILAAAVLVQARAWRWLTFSIVLGLLVQAALLVGDAAAYRLAIPFLPSGESDVYQRTFGFRALANKASQFVAATGAPTIAGEDRKTVAALLYYMRDQRLQILAWPSPDVPTFDMTRPLKKEARHPIVFLTECASARRLDSLCKRRENRRNSSTYRTDFKQTLHSLSTERPERRICCAAGMHAGLGKRIFHLS
jgi:Dolichyl-phosphate-mannose-protein mannosyltransferase